MRKLGRAWRLLRSTHTATWLLLSLTLVVALGSCLPQLPADAASQKSWHRALGYRFGGLADALGALRLTRFYASFWLWIPALALLASLATCTTARARAIYRSATLYSHLAPFLVVLGMLASALFGQRQRLVVAVGGPELVVAPPRGPSVWSSLPPSGQPIGAATEAEAEPADSSPAGRSGQPEPSPSVPANDAASGTFHLVAKSLRAKRTATGLVLGFWAGLEVTWANGRKCQGEAGTNRPLHCHGYSFVLLGVQSTAEPGRAAGSATSGPTALSGASRIELLAVRDPGYPLVIAGLGVLGLASSISLLRPRRWRWRGTAERCGRSATPEAP